MYVDGCVDPKSRGAAAGYGAKFTELGIEETEQDGSPSLGSEYVYGNGEKSNFGGQCADVYFHKNGTDMIAQVLVGVDATITTKSLGKVKYIEGRKVTFSAPRHQESKWHVKENKGVTRKALIPSPSTDFNKRIRICRIEMWIDPEHYLANDDDFKAYCKKKDEELWYALEADLSDMDFFEYFREIGVCTHGYIIEHLRANKADVDQSEKEERAMDYMACDISRAVTWPFRRDKKRGIMQAIVDQANQDQLVKFKMGEKLAAIVLGFPATMPQKALLDFGMPKVSAKGRPSQAPKQQKEAALESAKVETRGRKAGSSKTGGKSAAAATQRRSSQRSANTTKNAKELAQQGLGMPGAQVLLKDKDNPGGLLPKPQKGGSQKGYASDAASITSMGSNMSSISSAMTQLETKVDDLPRTMNDWPRLTSWNKKMLHSSHKELSGKHHQYSCKTNVINGGNN